MSSTELESYFQDNWKKQVFYIASMNTEAKTRTESIGLEHFLPVLLIIPGVDFKTVERLSLSAHSNSKHIFIKINHCIFRDTKPDQVTA